MAKVCKFQIEKNQVSYDCGEIWEDTGETRKIEGQAPVERYSPDCGWSDSFLYEWFTVSGEYLCNGYHKYTKLMQRVSYNLGEEWEVVEGSEQIGTLVERFSPDCCQLRTVTGETCDLDFRKVNASIEEASLDGEVWVQTGNYTINSVINAYSPDCLAGADIKFLGIPASGLTGDSKFSYKYYEETYLYDTDKENKRYTNTNYVIIGCDRGIVGNTNSGYGDYFDSGGIEEIYVRDCAVNPAFICNSQDTLKKIHISSGVTGYFGGFGYIVDFGGQFGNCYELTEIDGLGDSMITGIFDGTFYGCTSLSSVTIPEMCIYLGNEVFSGCTGLTSVTFLNSYLPKNDIVNTTTRQFKGCTSLKDVSFTESFYGTIQGYMFADCTNLSGVTLGNPTAIEAYAFDYCTSLVSIDLGSNLRELSPNVFHQCTSLTDVYIRSTYDVDKIYTTTFPSQCTFHVLSEKYDYWNNMFPGRVVVINDD